MNLFRNASASARLPSTLTATLLRPCLPLASAIHEGIGAWRHWLVMPVPTLVWIIPWHRGHGRA